ncbi:MAG: hypothetical protein IE909_06655 [Campylobacterales bacterium]|nr:hypothetical protein [Campylobacterales bacterium]
MNFIGENIISAGDDNTVMLHDRYGNLIKSYTHTAKLRYIATNGNHIAVSGGVDNAILIFDANLNLIQTITSPTKPTGLSYSPDGSKLVAGTASSPNQVIVYKSTNYKPISTMTSHDNLTMALAWLDNNTVVSGGGSQYTIYIWRPSKTPKILTTIEGKGRSIWSVGIKGDTIAWGNTWTEAKGKSKFEKSFNLQTHEISDANANFNRINSTGLSHSKGGNYGYDYATLTIASSKALSPKMHTLDTDTDAMAGIRTISSVVE